MITKNSKLIRMTSVTYIALSVATSLSISAQSLAAPSQYVVTRLVSDIPKIGKNVDPALVNPWGTSFAPGGPVWVSNNGTQSTTVYSSIGGKELQVSIPGVGGQPFNPTGQIFNGDPSAFPVSENGQTGPSRFVFDGEEGVISGWNPGLDFGKAVVAVDNSASGAVYKGLEVVPTPKGPLLLAANFNSGKVELYGKDFKPLGAFADPKAPKGYAPFNIHLIGKTIFVLFAKQDDLKHDNVNGPGLGYISIFDPLHGKFAKSVIDRVHLNAPWGITIAPKKFGQFSNAILVGNFGDGLINGYDGVTGKYIGALLNTKNTPIVLKGLWSIYFGDGGQAGPVDSLYYTQGYQKETHGILGVITLK